MIPFDYESPNLEAAARWGRKRALTYSEEATQRLNRGGPQRHLRLLPAEVLALVAAIADYDSGFAAALDDRSVEAIERLSATLSTWEELSKQ